MNICSRIMLNLLFLLLMAQASTAQSTEIDTNTIKKEMTAAAKDMRKLLLKKDYEAFAQYLHPKLFEMAGGKEILIKAFANELQKMEDDDFKFKSIEIGKAFGIIQVGEELQCVIPEIMNIKTRGKTIISQSYLIALSPDLGKTWYFIDTRNKPVSQLQSVFPNLSNKLHIPEKTEPQIIAD